MPPSREIITTEPSRRLFGGLPAVYSLPNVAVGEGAFVRLPHGRVIAASALAASAILAITAATALPSTAPATTASARPQQPQPQYLGAAIEAPAAQSESDPAIRRFTGLVGADLSRSLASAGVPERQGREYVGLLGKAIHLEEGLSVDDRFDLVVQRNDEGSLGQLLYAGMDRVARADVELMKWTDGKNAGRSTRTGWAARAVRQ